MVACRLSLNQWSAVGRMSPLAASAATSTADADADAPSEPIHIAYAGNSMIYFHDTPRFFANLATKRRVASHDCCLRGGASLPSLLPSRRGLITVSVPRGKWDEKQISDLARVRDRYWLANCIGHATCVANISQAGQQFDRLGQPGNIHDENTGRVSKLMHRFWMSF